MSSIFEKIQESDSSDDKIILSYEDILKAIPKNAKKEVDLELQKSHIEWRWRFFNINNRKVVEISKKLPNQSRIYIDNNGNWLNDFEYDPDANLDKYLTDQVYAYVIESN